MTGEELAGRLERIHARLKHWKYADAPEWMKAELRGAPDLFASAAKAARLQSGESNTMATRLSHAINLYSAATGVTQKELAQQWECSEATASRFLRGQSMPDAATCIRIIAWAFCDEHPMDTITRIAGSQIANDIRQGLKAGLEEFNAEQSTP